VRGAAVSWLPLTLVPLPLPLQRLPPALPRAAQREVEAGGVGVAPSPDPH